MIQILGLRPYTDKNGVVKLTDAFLERGWRAENIYDLFQHAKAHAERIPEDTRWNMFYTVANCTDAKRQFLRQDVLPLDIDGIERGTEDKIVDVVCAELDLPKDKLGIVYSGNGVHILVGLKTPITEASYLRVNKPYYRALCGRINNALYEAGIKGHADPVVFSEARLLRMPFTENRKEGKHNASCILVNGNLVPLDVDLFSLADLPSVDEGEHIHPRALSRLPKPDSVAVQEKCGFLVHCKDKQSTVSEPEWYAMLSIVGRLENGQQLVHEYSKDHPQYNPGVTDDKVKHALEASGPRTCANISTMYEGCKTCPFNGKVASPIQIVGENTIRTLETGFYNVVVKDGVAKQGKPNYDDLAKYYEQKHAYVTITETEQVLTWCGTHWQETDKATIHAFAEKSFSPTPTNAMCCEFESKLKRTNLRPSEFTNVEGKLNFKNGVLDLETGAITPHSTQYGFTYTIPYDFAPTGACPTFEKFLRDISCEDEELGTLIAEYMGYCLSGVDPSLVQKCAVLHGDGSNGKSVLLHLMRELVGPQNCVSISIGSLGKDNYRYQLRHKMFNVSDEAPNDAFLNSSIFKAIVSGDTIEIRKLYAEPLMWKCTTKLMFACNELPFSADFSHGMFRRLIVIPFRKRFDDALGNKDPFILKKLLVEKSDIFNYCLTKFLETKERGYAFTNPMASAEELTEYIETSDLVDRFVYGVCKQSDNPNQGVDVDSVYNIFCLWCKDNNQKPMSFTSFCRRFGRKISARYPRIEKLRPRDDGGRRITKYSYLIIDAVNPAVMSGTF
jgi:P4 family phage/plasmid primase-like protien